MFDVLIIGAGLVGASLAAALRNSGLTCAVIDGAPPSPPQNDAWDTRIYAVSPGSQAFLESISAWDRLDARRMAPVHAMNISGDQGAQLEFSAYESGAERLATILESGALQRALWQSLQDQPGVQLFCPARPERLELRADCVLLDLAGMGPVRARLLVGADGARSWVREAAGMSVQSRPAVHSGVVANFACEKRHRGVAFQWFRDDGVLAWLPLPGEHFSMVWSTPPGHAESLISLPAKELCAEVMRAGGHALGMIELVSAPAAFPISPAWVPHRTRPRVVLIGDAAHVVHPLAGQGVNLGFGDAAALAGILRDPADRAADPGDWMRLRRFERGRAGDILAMRAVTEGLQRLFAARSETLVRTRNFGLGLTGRMPLVKNVLARRAMGIG